MKGYIYVLKDPRDQSIRYVGQTINYEKRLEEHVRDYRRAYRGGKPEWMLELRQAGLRPVMEVIEECEPWMVFDRERFWIEEMRSRGCNLTNVASVPKHLRGDISDWDEIFGRFQVIREQWSQMDHLIMNRMSKTRKLHKLSAGIRADLASMRWELESLMRTISREAYPDPDCALESA